MNIRKIGFLCFVLAFVSSVLAQKGEKLRVGEKIPFARVEVIDKDKKPTNLDFPNGKSTSDRFVLVYFFAANTPVKELITFNSEIERVLNKYQNNACKGASEIEYATICLEKNYDTWQSILNQTNINKNKFSGKKTNYMASGGMQDRAAQAFKVTKTPTLYLVNPKGRLYLETDSFQVLEKTFQNICRINASYSTADISGKILSGEKAKTPIANLEVYLVKSEKDTLKRTSTDGYGDFVFKQVDTTQDLSIRISQTEKVKAIPKIYLAKQSGAIVAEFKKTQGGFEYKLLETDVVRLSQIEDEDDEEDITMKYRKMDKANMKDISITENIYYELGKFDIVPESEIVLDKVIVILNANPKVRLEVVSHTDSQGDDASNLKLSQNRSNAVIDYLVSKGIDKARLKAVGKGESEIRNRCANGISCSDKEHAYNRRTEFKFIKS
ncbi:MAG: OmpA family protein [Bacteroidetes bacterium]|nr:OmpA family protein [Bacteroidota bacterium]